jgi:hypothetical protein
VDEPKVEAIKHADLKEHLYQVKSTFEYVKEHELSQRGK